jgi:glycosyltransferase involved in cell wall biosynthesis
MKKLISIVIPAYNEEEVIPKLGAVLIDTLKKLTNYQWEVIIVDNGSHDHTLETILKIRTKDKRFKAVQLAKNELCDGGIIAGLSFAKGDAAVIMMADLQESPDLITKFLQKWEAGYDIVYAVVKRRIGTTIVRKIVTVLFYRVISFLTRGMIMRDVSDFRLIDRRVYEAIVATPEHNKFFRGISTWVGFKSIGIPFVRQKRAAGESKADFRSVWTVAVNGMLSFSYMPLKLSWWVMGISFVSACIVYILTSSPVITLFLLLLSILCLLIGIQNEYMIRVLEEVRGRPNFIVKKSIGFPHSV